MSKNMPNMVDPKLYKMAGIDPKTGLPSRAVETVDMLKNMKCLMRIIDEQDAVNRYKWYNLPCNISSEELERLLYFKGQLCFFYFKGLKEFYFMPFALDGTIDFYGRYNKVHPVPMTGGTDNASDEDKAKYKAQLDMLSTVKLNVVKAVKEEEELSEEDLENSCVILRDYTPQLGQNIIPRQALQDPLIEFIAEMPCYIRTAMIAATGIKGMRVNNADAKDEVNIAAGQIVNAALTGKLAVPITATVEIQELFDGKSGGLQDFLLTMQAFENLRLATYGLDNGGIFEKKAHKLEGEQEMNSSTVGLVNDDGLAWRQNFCNIANSIWGTSMWCEPSESVVGADLDGDGDAIDRNEAGENSGVESASQEGGQE